jgi:hypothetical protein
LGTLYLIKYLTEVGKNTPLVCAVTVSGCLSLLETGEATRDNENRAYWYILASATKQALRRFLSGVSHLSEQVRAKLTKCVETERDPLRMYDYFQFYTGPNAQRYDRAYTYLGPTRNHYESLYKDVHTDLTAEAAQVGEGNMHMDAMAFGMGGPSAPSLAWSRLAGVPS